MTDAEYELHRNRAILAAFQTGRPVSADNEGVMRFTDGAQEPVPGDVGVPKQPMPRAAALAVRVERASHRAFVLSIVAAVANGVGAFWNWWQAIACVVFVGSAVIWRRVNRQQRSMSRAGRCD